jgi:predicted ATPase
LHSHIAKSPPKVHEINDEVPPIISDIVDRLLAKTAEDRYQSAAAVAHDLQLCLDGLDSSGKIEHFEIGSTDVVERFSIPQKLYGRELEVERLLESFERVAEGGRELVLVSGYSGVGKTRLVREVHRPITSRRGFFAAGKYDQLQRTVPYSALIQTFTQLIRHLLTLGSGDLALWKERIWSAVGQNGQIIIDVIPDLEHLIGEQEAPPELPPLEARNRFNLVFESFARAFAHEEHPVVLFLDDLQWADKPSLNLIGRFQTDEATRFLMIVGAYRDNEVDELHPLMLKLEDLRDAGATIEEIELAPLAKNDVARLIADTLSVKAAEREVQQLSKICFEKTEGNPFFLSRLLLEIYNDGALSFDREQRRWIWELSKIRAMQVEA